MSVSGPRILVLTGAPLSSTLQWADEQLTAPLHPCLLETQIQQHARSSPSGYLGPAWRSLSSKPTPLPTGFTPEAALHDSLFISFDREGETSFLTSVDVSLLAKSPGESTVSTQISIDRSPTDDDSLTQFYEHSLTVHDEFTASQMQSVPQEDFSPSFEIGSENSFINASYDSQSRSSAAYRHGLLSLDDLKDIPNANYLQSIAPQTASVNIVIGVISIYPPRSIRTRRDGQLLELVELIVGDETKTGFGITIWLPSDTQKTKDTGVRDIRSEVGQLRPQDIVLLKNVALSSFMGKVYGQSLRKELTTIELLNRNKVDSRDNEGIYSANDLEDHAMKPGDPIRAKVRKVKGWVMSFVGASRKGVKAGGRRGGPHLQLPPDTQ